MTRTEAERFRRYVEIAVKANLIGDKRRKGPPTATARIIAEWFNVTPARVYQIAKGMR